MERLGEWLRRRSIAKAFLVVLISLSVLGAPPALAHRFTKGDGNDTPSRLDIRSASVRHKAAAVVHTIQTYDRWAAPVLSRSLLLVGIDKNFDNDFELCAFIYYDGRLRGALTNCLDNVIGRLPVAKPSGTTASIVIPKDRTGALYRWTVVSLYVGAGPCANECLDLLPNRPPPILHDLKPPAIDMPASNLYVWRGSTDLSFGFPFAITDKPGAGVKSWKVMARSFLENDWQTVATGVGGGVENLTVVGTEGTQSVYRVRAVDKQGNVAIRERAVYIPWDEDNLGSAGSFVGADPVSDSNAFGGTYQALDAGDAFTYEFTHPQQGTQWCWTTEIIGTGDGDWVVSVSIGGTFHHTISATEVPDGARRVVAEVRICLVDAPIALDFTVQSGSGFGVDALSIRQSGHL